MVINRLKSKAIVMLMITLGASVTGWAAASQSEQVRNPFLSERQIKKEIANPVVTGEASLGASPGFASIPEYNNQEIRNARWIGSVNGKDVYINEDKEQLFYLDIVKSENDKPIKTSLAEIKNKPSAGDVKALDISEPLPKFIPIKPVRTQAKPARRK